MFEQTKQQTNNKQNKQTNKQTTKILYFPTSMNVVDTIVLPLDILRTAAMRSTGKNL